MHGSIQQFGEISINILKVVKNYNIECMGSMVAIPELVGWSGVEKTIRDLDSYGVKSLRVHLPTYTNFTTKAQQRLLYCDEEDFKNLMTRLQNEIRMNLHILPYGFENVKPEMMGYEDVGINPSDEVISVDCQKVFCRNHAFNLFSTEKRLLNVKIKSRTNEEKELHIYSRALNKNAYPKYFINNDIYFDVNKIERI